jgi:hypothetical protein
MADHLSAAGATREGILAETLMLHDLRHGNAHCDRKYVQVCRQFQALIFEAGERVRRQASTEPPAPARRPVTVHVITTLGPTEAPGLVVPAKLTERP